RRHELPDDGPELVAQFRQPAADEALDAFAGRSKVLPVRGEAVGLEAEHEIVGRLVAPLGEGRRLEGAVEGAIDLDGRELAAGVVQLAAVRQAGRVEIVAPGPEGPAADAHMDARGPGGGS